MWDTLGPIWHAQQDIGSLLWQAIHRIVIPLTFLWLMEQNRQQTCAMRSCMAETLNPRATHDAHKAHACCRRC
jgi:hypothetical protein